MKLFKENNPIPINDPSYLLGFDAGQPIAGFSETNDIIDYDDAKDKLSEYGTLPISSNPNVYFRDEMIYKFLSGWNGYNDDEKKALLRNYIYPNGTPINELDALYSEEKRNQFKINVIKSFKITDCSQEYIPINAHDSDKCHVLRIADNGTIDSIELNTYTPITAQIF